MAALTSKLPKQPLTSHPSVKSKLETGTFLTFALRYISETTTVHVSEYDYREDSVVVSGNLITSRGPGMPILSTIIFMAISDKHGQALRFPLLSLSSSTSVAPLSAKKSRGQWCSRPGRLGDLIRRTREEI